MKIRELLLELREILDRNIYGSWIDANTKEVHPILSQGGHADFIKERLHDWNIPQEYITSSQDYYTVGHAHGFIRAMYKPRGHVEFEGMANDLHKIARIIIATSVQSDVYEVAIGKHTDLESTDHTNYKRFTMPNDLNVLKAFILK